MDYKKTRDAVLRDYKRVGLRAANFHRQELDALTPSQRALIAVSLGPQIKTGAVHIQRQRAQESGETVLASTELAEAFEVSRFTISAARRVLAEGSPEELEAAETGKFSVGTIVTKMRKNAPVEERIRWFSNRGLADKGKNVDRLHMQEIEGQVWQQFKSGLIALATLPQASDVEKLARRMDRNNTVKQKLEAALTFLKEFAEERRKIDDEKAA